MLLDLNTHLFSFPSLDFSLFRRLRCLECETTVLTEESVFDYSVSMASGESLLGALTKYFCEGYLRGENKYHCEACARTGGGLAEAREMTHISRLSEAIVVHVKVQKTLFLILT